MNDENVKLAADRRLLQEAEARGTGAKVKAYAKLSGPGWLQSALTLGGGTLAGSLYLGVLAGPHLLWLQPVAMALGIIMMSAIGYVSLSINERPFHAINRHINPILGWGWAMAALAACMVWVMPQYSLANGVVQQTLLPGIFGADGLFGDTGGKLIVTTIIFATVLTISWNYGRGGLGVKLYELILKLTVIAIVICFVGVVLRLAFTPQGLDWAAVWKGLWPNPKSIFQPAQAFLPLLEAIPAAYREYWTSHLVTQQRDVAVTVAAATIGINATFLFAYSLRRHGWGKEFRGFVKFDLATGMLIPFMIVTACVVIAGMNQFHAVPQAGLLAGAPEEAVVTARQTNEFNNLLRGRVLYEAGAVALTDEEVSSRIAALGDGDRIMAATLVTRDAFDLAASLRPFTGDFFARIIFSLGVIGMTLSSITLHMVISGMVICEILKRPLTGWTFRIGSLAAATGVLGPFLWSKAAFWLVVPTSIFAFILLPIAFITFFLMMNQRKLLGDDMPTGGRRWAWNTAMGVVVAIFVPASLYMVWDKGGGMGVAAVIVFLAAVLVTHLLRKKGDESPGTPLVRDREHKTLTR